MIRKKQNSFFFFEHMSRTRPAVTPRVPPFLEQSHFPESGTRASSDILVTVQQEARNDVDASGREGFHAGD